MTTSHPAPREVNTVGQVVGVYEYGDPDGAPVMILHGTPARGAGFAWADAPARERGLRLIAPDRPGVGLSSRVTGFRVADYPAQVVALADALEIDRFAVVGYSGGGPYAAACAALAGDRVSTAAVAAGMGQIGVWASFDEFEQTDRQMFTVVTKYPAVARIMLATSNRLARMSPQTAMKSFEKQMTDSDRAVARGLGEPADAMALFTQAFLRGAHGVVADYLAISVPWELAVERITIPLAVFHGDQDTMVPVRHGEELARRVPGATFTVWPGEGHLGTITHIGEILDGVR